MLSVNGLFTLISPFALEKILFKPKKVAPEATIEAVSPNNCAEFSCEELYSLILVCTSCAVAFPFSAF